MLTTAQFTAMVDHTLLRPDATAADVESLCAQALDLRTAAVCVNGMWVATVRTALSGSGVRTCGVVGFPLGAMSVSSVSAEVVNACGDGAEEIDMVMPLGLLKSGNLGKVTDYIAAVRHACRRAALKVIIESAALHDEQIVAACRCAMAAGAQFVKTSTGFHPAGGATPHAVRLIRATVGESIGVKASGGIRSVDDVTAMIAAGADRLGMSATAAVAAEFGR